MSEAKDSALLLQCPHMCDQRLDLVVAQLVFEGFHLFLPVFFQPFLDRSEHLVVFQSSLVLRISLVFDAGHLAGLGLAFAVLAMAGGTMLGPVGLDVRGPGWSGEENQCCSEEKQFFHDIKVVEFYEKTNGDASHSLESNASPDGRQPRPASSRLF